jgi:hypothetical protein
LTSARTGVVTPSTEMPSQPMPQMPSNLPIAKAGPRPFVLFTSANVYLSSAAAPICTLSAE